MTQNDIIEMAKQAGFRHPNPHDGYMGLAYDRRDGTDTGSSLEAFAKLVAAKEREACAKVCDEVAMFHEVSQGSDLAFDLAKAIRARGEE